VGSVTEGGGGEGEGGGGEGDGGASGGGGGGNSGGVSGGDWYGTKCVTMFVVPHHWFSLAARAMQPAYVRALTLDSP